MPEVSKLASEKPQKIFEASKATSKHPDYTSKDSNKYFKPLVRRLKLQDELFEP